MAIKVNYELKTSRGESYAALDKVIELRKKKLNETTENAVVATMITVLRSLRAATMVAKPPRFRGQFGSSTNYFPGWATVGGKKIRVVRLGDERGPRLTGAKVVAHMSPRERGGIVFVVSDAPPAMPEKYHDDYLLIAKSRADAMKYVKERHAKRVRRYAGLARYTIAIAQGLISTRVDSTGLGFAPTGKARVVAIKNLKKRITRTSENYAIDISDTLRYAVAAVAGGQAGVEMSMRRAANATVGMIKRKWGAAHPFDDMRDIETPFPELARKKGL